MNQSRVAQAHQEREKYAPVVVREFPREGKEIHPIPEISLSLHPDMPLHSVRRVTYILDSAFPAPTRMARNAENRFLLRLRSWGAFSGRARILYQDGSEWLCKIAVAWKTQGGKNVPDLSGPLDEDPLRNQVLLAKRFKSIGSYKRACECLEKAALLTAPGKQGGKPAVVTHGWVIQQLAVCTYKDSGKRAAERLDEALTILKRLGNLEESVDPETLGIAGAIYKRKWQVDGQLSSLETSTVFYRKGFEAAKQALKKGNPEADFGYPGINAAFNLDLLARVEAKSASRAGGSLEEAIDKRREAVRLRTEIRDLLEETPRESVKPEKLWWHLVTLGEACIGLGDYPGGRKHLLEAWNLSGIDGWEKESTCTQVSTLIRMRETDLRADFEWEGLLEDSETKKKLDAFFPLEEKDPGAAELASMLRATVPGKIGLALSGGGFRASLFHIGVLARLAEVDLLRHIEIISCVSGGSIIGAHYYLEVRKLLEEKEDADIKPEDYLAIVRRIVDRFREAVRKNLRTRVLANPWNHLRQAVLPDPFSWTEAMGELYESLIFSKVKDDEPDGPRWLNDLFIQPAGRVEGGFSPGLHNWSRKAKVPVLVLNATTLNTGHTWQFTASWMGEPPAGVDKEVDSNPRLRRMYYHEAPRPFQRIRLGRAVAASSCVPGLFPPIVFDGLYQKDYVLKLVDGGVHDNQGSRGLLEQDCNVLLISDASGQMESETKVSGSALQVLPRSNNILQSRVREAQFLDLDSRRRSLQLKGLMFIHLRKSLSSEAVDWIDAKEGPSSDRGDPDTMAPRRYGIAEEIQEKTAALRTDLDSFSDSEAYALMYEGYRMTEVELPLAIAWLAGREGTRQEWKFLAARDRMAPSRPDTGFERVLEVGKRNGFKLFALEPWLGWLLGGLSAAGLGALAMAAIRNGTFLNLLKGMVWISGIAVAAFLVSLLLRSFSPRAAEAQEALIRRLVGLGMGTLGWIPFFLHLKVFDPLFLWSGRLKPAEPDPGRPGSRADKQP